MKISYINLNSKENNFTVLRLIAACMVLFGHSFDLLEQNRHEPLARLTGFESSHGLAVSTFFVISGFLVTASITRSSSLFNYLAKRCLRIFPALVITVLLTVFVLGPLVTVMSIDGYFFNGMTWSYLETMSIYGLKYNLPGVFENNPLTSAVNGSLWTLPIEFSGYLFLIFIYRLNASRPIFLLSSALLCMFLNLKFINLVPPELLSMSTISVTKFGTFFFLGGFLFSVSSRLKVSYYHYIFAWVLLIAGAATSYHFYFYYLIWPYIVIITAFLPIPYAALLEKFGDISYGVYLYAFPVQQSVLHYCGSGSSVTKLIFYALPVTLLLGTLSWIAVEKPALKLKRRLKR